MGVQTLGHMGKITNPLQEIGRSMVFSNHFLYQKKCPNRNTKILSEGGSIRLMEEILHHLIGSLPSIYKVLHLLVLQDILHQQYHLNV